jgi:hypothetical protein
LSQAFTSKNVMGPNGSTLVLSDYVLTDGNNGNNYTVQTTTTATGTITPAQLIYVADPVSRTYGTSIGNGDLTGSLGGLQGRDTQAIVVSGKLKFKTETSASANVGSYAINGSGLTVINANYLNVVGQAAGNATALTVVPPQLTYGHESPRTCGDGPGIYRHKSPVSVLGRPGHGDRWYHGVATTADITSISANIRSWFWADSQFRQLLLRTGRATPTLTIRRHLDLRRRWRQPRPGTPNPVFTGTVADSFWARI